MEPGSMEQVQWLVWGVGFLFYIPLHVGLPLLYLLIQGKLAALPKGIGPFLIESSLVAVMIYGLAAVLWAYSAGLSIGILVLLMAQPWYRVVRAR